MLSYFERIESLQFCTFLVSQNPIYEFVCRWIVNLREWLIFYAWDIAIETWIFFYVDLLVAVVLEEYICAEVKYIKQNYHKYSTMYKLIDIISHGA